MQMYFANPFNSWKGCFYFVVLIYTDKQWLKALLDKTKEKGEKGKVTHNLNTYRDNMLRVFSQENSEKVIFLLITFSLLLWWRHREPQHCSKAQQELQPIQKHLKDSFL